MITSKATALGIIFPNGYDRTVKELTAARSTASIPFAGRYRMVDFVLSSMVNSGISNVSILCRENYLSLMDHLGSGREWDLARKNGGLNLVPPFSLKENGVYAGRIPAIKSILGFLQSQKENYVVLADANVAANVDFKAILNAHIASNADVTIAYNKVEAPDDYSSEIKAGNLNFYCLETEGDTVTDILISPIRKKGILNFSMGITVCGREWLIETIRNAYVDGLAYFERDVLKKRIGELSIKGYEFKGYVARIMSMRNYFEESMKLLEEENLDALFNPNPIYTKVRDDNPTRYIGAPSVKKSVIADGCVIEGTVENCILFRGVKIGKGAVVKNCVLMQDTVIEAGAKMEYTIADKDVTLAAGHSYNGSADFPAFLPKGKKA